MTKSLFWLSDEAWKALEPDLPKNQPRAPGVDDRPVISGILHVLKVGCRWRDVPEVCGPAKTIYDRSQRWSQRHVWQRIFEKMATDARVPQELSIDSTHIKAHRSAQGSKGGTWVQAIGTSRGGRTSKIHRLADDCGRPVAFALTPGNIVDIKLAIPLLEAIRPTACGIAPSYPDQLSHLVIGSTKDTLSTGAKNMPAQERHRVPLLWAQELRRIATRYDRLASNYLAALALISTVIAWS